MLFVAGNADCKRIGEHAPLIRLGLHFTCDPYPQHLAIPSRIGCYRRTDARATCQNFRAPDRRSNIKCQVILVILQSDNSLRKRWAQGLHLARAAEFRFLRQSKGTGKSEVE